MAPQRATGDPEYDSRVDKEPTDMFELQPALIQCPDCREQIEVLVGGSVERQDYVEDCSVCCRG